MFNDKDFLDELNRRKNKYGYSDEDIAIYIGTDEKTIKRLFKAQLNPNYRFLFEISKLLDGRLKIIFDNKNTLSFSEEIVDWFEKVKSKTGDSNDEIIKKMLHIIFVINKEKIKSDEKEYQIWKKEFEKLEEMFFIRTTINKKLIKQFILIIKNTIIKEIETKKFVFKIESNNINNWNIKEKKINTEIDKNLFMNVDLEIEFIDSKNNKIGYVEINYYIKVITLDNRVIDYLNNNKELIEVIENRFMNNEIYNKTKEDIKKILNMIKKEIINV